VAAHNVTAIQVAASGSVLEIRMREMESELDVNVNYDRFEITSIVRVSCSASRRVNSGRFLDMVYNDDVYRFLSSF
jgi:hypothetical protein